MALAPRTARATLAGQGSATRWRVGQRAIGPLRLRPRLVIIEGSPILGGPQYPIAQSQPETAAPAPLLSGGPLGASARFAPRYPHHRQLGLGPGRRDARVGIAHRSARGGRVGHHQPRAVIGRRGRGPWARSAPPASRFCVCLFNPAAER
jgi:hypothetical protein